MRHIVLVLLLMATSPLLGAEITGAEYKALCAHDSPVFGEDLLQPRRDLICQALARGMRGGYSMGRASLVGDLMSRLDDSLSKDSYQIVLDELKSWTVMFGYCPPKEPTPAAELPEILLDYLESHPEDLDKLISVVHDRAYKSKFPCD